MTVVLVGALVVLGLVLGLSFLLGWPRTRRSAGAAPRRSIATGLVRAGAPADVYVGAHFAFDRGRGMRSISPRLSILAGALALGVVVALAMLVSGIDRLYRVPAEHGWPWDAAIGNVNFPLSAETRQQLADDPRFEAQTAARYGQAVVGGMPVEILAVDQAGTAPPQLVSGRLPGSPDEIAVAGRLLRDLGLDMGDTVRFSVADSEFDLGERTTDLDLRIVGVTLPPILGEADMGESAVVTLDAIAAAGGNSEPHLVLVELRGDDPGSAVAELERDLTQEVISDTTPSRIVNLHRVRALPLLGVVLAATLGTVILVSTIAFSVRARRRDLSVLRVLGLPPGRLTTVLASQGIALAAATLLVGIFLGLIGGSLLWSDVAGELGVRDQPVVTPLLALLVPASLLVAALSSLVAARRSRRLPVAAVLRAE